LSCAYDVSLPVSPPANRPGSNDIVDVESSELLVAPALQYDCKKSGNGRGESAPDALITFKTYNRINRVSKNNANNTNTKIMGILDNEVDVDGVGVGVGITLPPAGHAEHDIVVIPVLNSVVEAVSASDGRHCKPTRPQADNGT